MNSSSAKRPSRYRSSTGEAASPPQSNRRPNMGSELKPAAGALTVACQGLSRQLATESRVTGNRHGHGTNNFEQALD